MKKILTTTFIIYLLSSCDPDVSGERINLPYLEFNLAVSPNKAYFQLGDTISFYVSIPSLLENGTKLHDGKAAIKIGSSLYPEYPIVSTEGVKRAQVNVDFNYVEEIGTVFIQPTTGNIFELHAYPDTSDSIKISFKYIPLKTGTYSFDLASLFYEGTAGKTRTKPLFDIMDNNGEELWRVPGMPALRPEDPSYKTIYYFAAEE